MHGAERALDRGQALRMCLRRVSSAAEGVTSTRHRKAGAHDYVRCRRASPRLGSSPRCGDPGEVVVGDGDVEAASRPCAGWPRVRRGGSIRVPAAQPRTGLGASSARDLGQGRLGRLQQLLAACDARSSLSRGFRHTISRSPGKSGAVICAEHCRRHNLFRTAASAPTPARLASRDSRLGFPGATCAGRSTVSSADIQSQRPAGTNSIANDAPW